MPKHSELPGESKILIPHEEVLQRITELAGEIANNFKKVRSNDDECLHLLCVLHGATPFATFLQIDLYKLGVRTTIDDISASSYGQNLVAMGEPLVEPIKKPHLIEGARVLVIDDIIDSGETLKKILIFVASLEPCSLQLAVLLAKVDLSEENLFFKLAQEVWIGFKTPLLIWVEGFGIDSSELNRDLPGIWARILGEDDKLAYERYMQEVSKVGRANWRP